MTDDLPPLIARLWDEREKRYEERFEAISKKISASELAAANALDKAEAAQEKRFQGVNELRGALSDATQNNISRVEVSAIRDLLESRLRAIENRLDKAEGAAQGIGVGWKALIGLIGLFSTVIAIYVAIK